MPLPTIATGRALLMAAVAATINVPLPPSITPLLGSELLTNGNMETGSPPSSWSAGSAATLSAAADQRTGGTGTQSLGVVNGANFGNGNQGFTSTVGTWYLLVGWTRFVTAANAQIKLRDNAGNNLSTATISSSSWAQFFLSGREPTTSGLVLLQNGDNTSGHESRFDDVSVKPITLASMLGSVGIAKSDYTAQVDLTLTAGTQAGMVLNLDDSANPANFLLAYHDGTKAYLDKCVAGTYTSIISANASYGAGRTLKVVKSGTSVSLYYNGVQIGTTSTVSDAGIISNTMHGLFSTYSGNSFANFSVV